MHNNRAQQEQHQWYKLLQALMDQKDLIHYLTQELHLLHRHTSTQHAQKDSNN
jgi:hypothetical protein